MKKKLSTTLAIVLVATSFIGCQKKEVEETSSTPEQDSTPAVEETSTLEDIDNEFIIVHGEDSETEDDDSDEATDSQEDDEDSTDSDSSDDDSESDTDSDEASDSDSDDSEDDSEEEEPEPLLDEELTLDGTAWTQPEGQENYKITLSNTGEEAVTFTIMYGTSEFEHEVTVSSMASKTIKVSGALAGEHNISFASDAEELDGTIQLWTSDEVFE